jgi:hypothetical protein
MTKKSFLFRAENIEAKHYNKILVSALKKHDLVAQDAELRCDDLLVHFFREDNKNHILGLMHDACNREIKDEKRLNVWHNLLDEMPGVFTLKNLGSLWSVADDFMNKAQRLHEERAPNKMVERAKANRSLVNLGMAGGRGYGADS